MKKSFRETAVLAAACLYALLLAGCATQGASQAQKTYILEPAVGAAAPAGGGRRPRPARSLLIGTPRAAAGYDTDAMVYAREPLELNAYRDSRWADAPARMIGPLLARSMEDSGLFGAVVSQPTAVDTDLQLDLTLLELRQLFLVQPSEVRLRLRVSLIDTARSRVLGSRLFELSEAAPSEDAHGGVQAANRALGRALEQIRGFVGELL